MNKDQKYGNIKVKEQKKNKEATCSSVSLLAEA